MGDLNTPKHRMLLARFNLQIHEQELVIEAKELRLLELAEEIENVKTDITASKAHIVKLKAEASQQDALMKEQEAANG